MSNFDNPALTENYFKLPTKEAKRDWLQSRGLSKFRDIVFPIVITCVSILSFILSIFMMCLPKPTSVTVLSVFMFLFVTLMTVFLIYSFWINGQGFFLFRYWYKPKPKKDFTKSSPNPPRPKTPSQPQESIDLDEF